MSDPKYTIYYWPGVPGRGEYIRLAFEASGVPYTYVDDVGEVVKLLGTTEHTPNPHFAPPILKIEYASGKTNFLSQSTNCLAYIGSKYGLVGDREDDDEETRAFRRAKCNQYVLTAMDLGIESHDLHHPIALSLYYEEQKDEALRRAGYYRRERVPKFFAHFDLAIKSNKEGKGYYLVGNSLTTADLFVMQVFDGVSHAVPRLVASLQKGGQYPNLFSWRSRLEEDPKIGPYLKSGRRLPFALGLYRHYPELDGEAQ